MNAGLAPIREAKTILLTTCKRDGTGVATPVSVAFDGERAFFRSYDKAWKTKRLRRDPAVQAAPATPRPPVIQARRPSRGVTPGGPAARGCARPWFCPGSRRWWCRPGSGPGSSPTGG